MYLTITAHVTNVDDNQDNPKLLKKVCKLQAFFAFKPYLLVVDRLYIVVKKTLPIFIIPKQLTTF